MLNYQRYKRVPVVDFPERTWPNKEIMKAPIWCSVDLRDGNQALVEPMVVEEKVEMFNLLVKLGFKEIEVGFPAASQIEYDFLRTLVERKLIPDDVEVQVLVQCREHLIKRTFEALEGVKKAIVHIYNSTSALQRDVVFHKDREDIKDIAVIGTKMVQRYMADCDTQIRLEYSPESFTGTELDFALDICTAVQETWGATRENPIIINLPSTVEMTTPNVYADQIEWMNTHFKNRESIILSIHPHNDRGEGVASTELALLAGADRVEGTLFGNGERTGNVDILTVAYNMFSQGINPELNIENIREIADVCERCTKMDIPPRHPYAGKLVFTAFSGSHQDAINKGTRYMEESGTEYWEVPYLPIDPADVGRQYEPIIRINSQSGKGGSAFVMQHSFGFDLPKAMHPEFGHIVQVETDRVGKELKPNAIYDLFKAHYIDAVKPYQLVQHSFAEFTDEEGHSHVTFAGTIRHTDTVFQVQGSGNGPIDAFFNAIHGQKMDRFTFIDYKEHAVKQGSDSQAVAYIHLQDENGRDWFGVGMSHNINLAPLKGILSAINRAVSHDGK